MLATPLGHESTETMENWAFGKLRFNSWGESKTEDDSSSLTTLGQIQYHCTTNSVQMHVNMARLYGEPIRQNEE